MCSVVATTPLSGSTYGTGRPQSVPVRNPSPSDIPVPVPVALCWNRGKQHDSFFVQFFMVWQVIVVFLLMNFTMVPSYILSLKLFRHFTGGVSHLRPLRQLPMRAASVGTGTVFASDSNAGKTEANKRNKFEIINQFKEKRPNVLNSPESDSSFEPLSKSAEAAQKVFEGSVVFPTTFMLKIVGVNDPTFINDILRIIQSCVGDQPAGKSLTHLSGGVTTKETAGGKYVSITLSPYFQNAAELYATYDAISKDKRVKFTL
jgi:putative lipoic acid-binding regulatory protein